MKIKYKLILIPSMADNKVNDLLKDNILSKLILATKEDIEQRIYLQTWFENLYVYIIDTEAIINEGEIGISLNPKDYGYIQPMPIFKPQLELENIKWFKAILATNNPSLQLPQLSQQALQTIVDNNGKLEEFDIKFKCGKYNRGGDDSCGICEISNCNNLKLQYVTNNDIANIELRKFKT